MMERGYNEALPVVTGTMELPCSPTSLPILHHPKPPHPKPPHPRTPTSPNSSTPHPPRRNPRRLYRPLRPLHPSTAPYQPLLILPIPQHHLLAKSLQRVTNPRVPNPTILHPPSRHRVVNKNMHGPAQNRRLDVADGIPRHLESQDGRQEGEARDQGDVRLDGVGEEEEGGGRDGEYGDRGVGEVGC